VVGDGAAAQTDAAVQALLDKWQDTLTKHNDAFVKAMTAPRNGSGPTIAGPINPTTPLYPWWDLIIVGPYQNTGPDGPFLPNKIVRGGDPVTFTGALWRNPVGINWMPGPSAALVTSGWQFQITFQSVNLTTVTPGPTGSPLPPYNPLTCSVYPADNFDIFHVTLTFPTPPPGMPHLYEVNAVADLINPNPVGPFAGYSSWVLDPDSVPEIYPNPPWPFPTVPGPMGPHWDYDQPARILVYS
jgi:hypothetical protein